MFDSRRAIILLVLLNLFVLSSLPSFVSSARPRKTADEHVDRHPNNNDDDDDDDDDDDGNGNGNGDVDKVSTTDFYELRVRDGNNDSIFIDKSMFLRDFLKGKEKISRITRPTGWGKSTNLNMLRRFLEIELNATNGKPLPKERCSNYPLFAGGEIKISNHSKKLLKPLNIAKYPDVMESHCQFPVISISFENIVGNDYQQIETKLKKLVTNLYREHAPYIRNRLDERYSNEFDAYIRETFDRFELEHSLLFLSRLLYARFKRMIYVLVDDYDQPAISLFYHLVRECRKKHSNMTDAEVYIKMSDSFELFKVMSLVEAMIGACLKNNPILKQGLVKGVFDINLTLFGGVTEAISYSLLDQTYSSSYGFTDSELDQLLQRDINPILNSVFSRPYNRSVVRSWYGYNFLGYPIYNPYCIARLVAGGGKFDYYWTERINNNTVSSIVHDILQSDSMQEGLQNLTGFEISFRDYRTKIHFDFVAGDFKILLFSGYLNPTVNGFLVTNLSIPNREIDLLMKATIAAWTSEKFNVSPSQLESTAASLAAFEADRFKARLKRILETGNPPSSSFTTTSNSSSNNSNSAEIRMYYNGLMKTMTFLLERWYRVINNKIVDPFKPNIILVSRSKSVVSHAHDNNANQSNNRSSGSGGRNVIVIDYKIISKQKNNLNNLKSETNIAWQKICGKMRYEGMAGYLKADCLLKFVLVFCGKKMNSEYEIIDKDSS